MKKIFLLLVLFLGFHSAWAHDVEVDGIYYNLNSENKTASVTFKGNKYNSYNDEYSGEIVIPETVIVYGTRYSVTSLGDNCFRDCSSLTSITIPNSVTSLGEACFYDCSSLTSITIPNSVKSLSNYCFSGCSSLTSITIPNSVTSLGDGCFSDCSSLTSITIPNSVTSLGDYCFRGCSSLTSITIPNSVTSLEDMCFSGCSRLTSITIPNSVTSLGWNCFRGCTSLTSITIPNSVTSLGDGCFYGCTSLTSIILLSTGASIGNNCLPDTSCKIYTYPRNFESLKSKYGQRVGVYGAPIYTLQNTGRTQTKLKFKVVPRTDIAYLPAENEGEYSAIEAKAYLEGQTTITISNLSQDECVFSGLVPNSLRRLIGLVRYSDGYLMQICDMDVTTQGTRPKISAVASTPTIVKSTGRFTLIDAHISEILINGQSVNPDLAVNVGDDNYEISIQETGFSPNDGCSITVKTEEGSIEWDRASVTSPPIKLTTLQPKCVSNSCAIVAATTNISDEETNVGFQWKKYDAPESLKPNEAYAAIYDGQLEGYLKNLQSASYYNVRAFYKAKNGTYYYGDWVTFDPSDFSYFDPTVHTYPVTQTTDRTASVRGYVLAGTDNITEQGFEYWETNGAASAQELVKNASLVPSAEDINVVLSTGQVMQVVLDGLKPQTTYTYRAFVRTTGGTTYGEEQAFTTKTPTGIDYMETDEVAPTIVGYYDLSGRKLAGKQRGLVIERYSDGTTRKVLVK